MSAKWAKGTSGPAGNEFQNLVGCVTGQATHAPQSVGGDASEDGTGRGTPIIPQVFSELGEGHQTYQPADVAMPLRTSSGGGGVLANLAVTPIDMRQASRGATMTNNRESGVSSGGAPGTGIGDAGDPAPSLANTHAPAVAYAIQDCRAIEKAQGGVGVDPSESSVYDTLDSLGQQGVACVAPEVASTLSAGVSASPGVNPPGRRQEDDSNVIAAGMTVRRLTPHECLLLQGLPPGWLDVEPPLSDSAKYRMIGNGGAVPCVEWIGRRIIAVEELDS